MKSILTEKARKEMLELIETKKTLIAFDFDGTLAPIVPDYRNAWMTPATARRLRELAKHEDVVVISGRGVKDLRERVGATSALLIGNHGVEASGVDRGKMRRVKAVCRKWVKQLRQMLDEEPLEGVRLEDKIYSLSLHYRGAKPAARAKAEKMVKKLRPRARVIPGKELFNIVPPSARHKGTALLRLMNRKGWSHAVFIGDDWTDEDVFRMKTKRFFTVRVGRHPLSRAGHILPRQSDINRFLDVILSRHGRRKRDTR